MSRLTRDVRLETREARSRLKQQHEPYWRLVHQGLFIGYRKGPRGGVWFLRRLVGRGYLKSRLGLADDTRDANGAQVLSYKQAHKKALDTAEQQSAIEAAGGRSDYTVQEVMKDYLEYCRSHTKGHRECANAVDAHIIPALGDKRVTDLSTRQIRNWHQRLADAPRRRRGGKEVPVDPRDSDMVRRRKATANRVLTYLKAALTRAWEEGYVSNADVWRRVKPFRNVDAPRLRYLSEEECAALLKVCEPDFELLVRGALLTGCRYGELAKLRCRDFNPDSGTITIRDAKSGKERHVPLTKEGATLLRRTTKGHPGDAQAFRKSDGEPWGHGHQVRRMREACAAAGIEPAASFHILRHTYGSLLTMRGTPLYVTSKAMGHADTRMTEKHYAHLQPSYVSDTIRAHLPSFTAKKKRAQRAGK